MSINWQDVITSLVVVTSGGTVLVGASAWLIKTAITHKLKTEEDAFKTRIKGDADAEIVRLKSSLQIDATERQIRFTKLHEKRAEIIAELYKKLVEIHQHGEYFVGSRQKNLDPFTQQTPDPATDKEFGKLKQEIVEFYRFYDQHQIYLPINVCRSLENLTSDIAANVYETAVFGPKDFFNQGYVGFDEKIQAARKALENEFRKMLGVDNRREQCRKIERSDQKI